MQRPSVLLLLLLLAGLWCLTHCGPHQYHFIGAALPWLKAQTHCRAQHTDLATVFNIEDMNRLLNSAQDSGVCAGKAWIGLHDNLTRWRWSFPDSRYYGDKGGDYRKWDYGQPDNSIGVHVCARMWREGSWDDSPCSLRLPFVCFDGTAGTYERFVLIEQESSWSEAQRYCRNFHTDLASVRNETENKEVELLAKGRSVWIGLYRTHEWSDQSNSTYRYWAAGQPDNFGVKQGCTSTDLGDAGLWSVDECSRELGFICYDKGKETDRTDSAGTDALNAYEDATAVTLQKTTTELKSTSGDPRTGPTSSELPSSPPEDPTTGPVNQEGLSTTTSTRDEITSNERDSTSMKVTARTTTDTSSEQPSTPRVDLSRPFTDESPDQQVWSTFPVTPSEASSNQFATTSGAPDHVIHLRVKLTSENELSEADISEQFHRLLVETGLSESIKVSLRKVQLLQTKRANEAPAKR